MRQHSNVLRLLFLLLLLCVLPVSCALLSAHYADKDTPPAHTTEPSQTTEYPEITDKSEETPFFASAALTQAAPSAATYEVPIAEIRLRLSGIPYTEQLMLCEVRLYRGNALVAQICNRPLHSGVQELCLHVGYTFTRYMEDYTDDLTAVLSCGDEQLSCAVTVDVTNAPDEVFAAASDSPYPYSIDVVRSQNVVLVYGLDETDGSYSHLVKAFVCSVGRYGRTPTGDFALSGRGEWRELFGGVYGQYGITIHGNILFHSVPYSSMHKNALRYDLYNQLGEPASMGCIRLTTADAKWLFDNCPAGTAVHIYDSDTLPVEKPTAAYIDPSDPRRGWDPTDPDSDNPWRESAT